MGRQLLPHWLSADGMMRALQDGPTHAGAMLGADRGMLHCAARPAAPPLAHDFCIAFGIASLLSAGRRRFSASRAMMTGADRQRRQPAIPLASDAMVDGAHYALAA